MRAGLNFVAIDFETASSQRASACALGIAVVSDGAIVEVKSWLIKPRFMYFDPFNVEIHEITPGMVMDEPEFDSLWPTFAPYLDGNLVIAHNASFDMSILRHTFSLYEIPFPDIDYSCTRVIAQSLWRGWESYSLPLVADRLGIQFEHHRADEDAVVCAMIALRACEDTGASSLAELAERLDIKHGRIFPGGYQPARSKTASSRGFYKRLNHMAPPIDALDPQHPLFGAHISFTGTLQSMPRREAIEKAVKCGATCFRSVNSEVDYMVLGQQDFRKLRDGINSEKLKKAKSLREKGGVIELISEDDFLRLLNS